ncbi:MAG: OmpA family protein [Alphaproteobacteria bacterium]
MMAKIAESIKKLPNKIAIVGHTDATPYRSGSGYSNWELSTDRAHASRRALIAAGLPKERLATVTGKAATDPLNKAGPAAPSNRRISILLLREATLAKPSGRGMSGTQGNPYSNYQAPVSPRPAAPVVTPEVEKPDEAAGIDSDSDPLEESSAEDEAIEEQAVKAAAESADTEAPPPVEIAPVQEEELVDSDLWQRL